MHSVMRLTLPLVFLLAGCGNKPAQTHALESVQVPVPASPEWSPHRLANIARLEEDGFQVSRSLPEGFDGRPRPTREVAARLMALKALFLRTVLPGEGLPDAKLQAYMDRNGLMDALTPSELAVWTTPRSVVAAQYGDSIGWKLENIWALAWVLGYDSDLSYFGGMVGPEQIDPIFREFTPEFGDGSLDAWVPELKPRSEPELVTTEDLFYCAHNAVRSAQLGHATVPKGFHPIGDGGTVHERRHVLTWALSPGVAWDDTDLST